MAKDGPAWWNLSGHFDLCVTACCNTVPSCSTLCRGRAWWPYTCACLPCVLCCNSARIYFWPCLGVYFNRCSRSVGCLLCRLCGCYVYEDKKFCGTKAIGELENGKADTYHWERVNDMTRDKHNENAGKVTEMKLFEGGIEPKDVSQGAVGDCWLMAAMASLAEYPGAVSKVFITREKNDRGIYVIRLYDAKIGRFVDITVDDKMPCRPGGNKAAFVAPNGNEMWTMLLEKAFAKFCGSYAALAGGYNEWAWEAMTGDPAHRMRRKDDGSWYVTNMYYPDNMKHKRHVEWRKSNGKDFKAAEMFPLLKKYKKRGAVMGASMHRKDAGMEERSNDGLVNSHAYSLLKVKEVAPFKFVKLRNPWGHQEWNGAWSDNSPLWREHPKVEKELKPEVSDDGIFWMAWEDFVNKFDTIQVLDRSSDDDLQLDVREDDGFLGPAKGCVTGCCTYWLCCKGCYAMFCGHHPAVQRVVERSGAVTIKAGST